MSERMQKAREAWDNDVPAYVKAIVKACDLPGSSQNKVAKTLGYSSAVVSQVISRKYPGDMDIVAKQVRVTETMDLLQGLPAEQRAKVHFIHYNHTNPIRDPNSPQSKEVEAKGFNIARRGDRFCLD